MTRKVWACEDCGWEWPLPTEPSEGAECDNCGGPIEPVWSGFVFAADVLEATQRAGLSPSATDADDAR